jgi:SPX domain protein involved in polyphosphate accumulation
MSSSNNFLKKSFSPDDINWRFEYKYHLHVSQYLAVKFAIQPYMAIDDYTLASSNKKYFVRSLYFDSLSFHAFHDKIDGNRDRLKLRIRTYTENPEEVEILKAEIKVRKNVTTEKYVAPIDLSDYACFMENHHWPALYFKNTVLSEFERYFHLKSQTPCVLVEYEREGFRARTGEELRITFDHKVRSTRSDQLFPKNPIFHEHSPGLITLEIKCNKLQPDWLHRLVRDHGLCIAPNSKFVQGMMASHPTVVTPVWSA